MKNKNLKNPILVDIDGTLADITLRERFVVNKPKDWKAFRDPVRVAKDGLVGHVAALIWALRAVGHEVVFVSSRTEDQRTVTEEWLKVNGLDGGVLRLLMRADGDNRDDTVVKKEMLDWLRAGGVDPWMAIDDRPKVLRMWREAGLGVVQVGRAVGAGGDF